MKLKKLIANYINYRRSFGEKFLSTEDTLLTFCRSIGDLNLKNITANNVKKYLYGAGPVTKTWFNKYTTLKGMYCYAISRGYVKHSPLPTTMPRQPPLFVPYIYTREELRKILQTIAIYQKNRSCIPPNMVRTLFLLLYGTGLRLSEALSLTIGDVDQHATVITVHRTKFYKSRLVPFGSQLAKIISEYFCWRRKIKGGQDTDAFFLCDRDGKGIKRETMTATFSKIREKASIKRTDGGRYQPRLHDLRHTFAVHRLVSWYQEGSNVQILLPFLSTYLGHTFLANTSVYLSMTDDLLQEANTRFENYAMEGL
jgi:integrase/recombinase XerD